MKKKFVLIMFLNIVAGPLFSKELQVASSTFPKIYFAGPLFSQAEKDFNLQLTKRIEALGFTVHLPQRDTPQQQADKKIFQQNRDALINADIFCFVLDGRVPDEGACLELGIAYGQKYFLHKVKPIVGLQTDKRAAFLDDKINPMLKESFDHIADSVDSLLAYLQQYAPAKKSNNLL